MLACLSNILKYLGCVCNVSCLSVYFIRSFSLSNCLFCILVVLISVVGGRVVRWCWVKLTVPGRPTLWIRVGQGPTALAVGAGGCCLDIFTVDYFSLLFLPLFGRRPDID